jgi:hypothetical protein
MNGMRLPDWWGGCQTEKADTGVIAISYPAGRKMSPGKCISEGDSFAAKHSGRKGKRWVWVDWNGIEDHRLFHADSWILDPRKILGALCIAALRFVILGAAIRFKMATPFPRPEKPNTPEKSMVRCGQKRWIWMIDEEMHEALMDREDASAQRHVHSTFNMPSPPAAQQAGA